MQHAPPQAHHVDRIIFFQEETTSELLGLRIRGWFVEFFTNFCPFCLFRPMQ